MMDYSKLISPSIQNLTPSGIRKFFDIAAEMKDAISLGVGEPDFVTPWAIREAGIYSLEKGRTHYSANSGLSELRNEICTYLKRKYSLSYNPKAETLVTVGGSEAIDLLIRAVISHRDNNTLSEMPYIPCISRDMGLFFLSLESKSPINPQHTHRTNISLPLPYMSI